MTHIEAMKQARSVISSINAGKNNALRKNNETVFWQREEWVRWALDEVLPVLNQAIAKAEKQEPVAWIVDHEKGVIAPQRVWVGLTDEEENALIPDPDGSAEVNVKHVEVLPGAWGKEFEEVDAWSKPLVLQMLHNHEAKLKQKNGYTKENT